jgi:hypothetical protein
LPTSGSTRQGGKQRIAAATDQPDLVLLRARRLVLVLITSTLCSIATTVLPLATSACSTSSSLATS